MQSQEGTQQGDPASMLLFSLTIQPLVRSLSHECNLLLNRWYADDGLIIGTIPEVTRALKLLVDVGPDHQFYMHVGKTKAFWPTIDPSVLRCSPILSQLTSSLMAVWTSWAPPIGSAAFMKRRIRAKLEDCTKALSLIDDVSDARIKFHSHRMTGSACRVQHLFRLVPPDLSFPFATQFDEDQMSAYSRFNNVPLSPPPPIDQIRLPLRLGGHGFTPLAPLIHASYAASLIESASIRIPHPQTPSVDRYLRMARPALRVFVQNLPSKFQPQEFVFTQNVTYDLGHFEPQARAQRPERTHHILFQAQSMRWLTLTGKQICGNPAPIRVIIALLQFVFISDTIPSWALMLLHS